MIGRYNRIAINFYRRMLKLRCKVHSLVYITHNSIFVTWHKGASARSLQLCYCVSSDMECYVKLYERKLQLFPEKHAKLSLNGICMWDEGVLFICSYSTIKLCFNWKLIEFQYYVLLLTIPNTWNDWYIGKKYINIIGHFYKASFSPKLSKTCRWKPKLFWNTYTKAMKTGQRRFFFLE